MADDIALSSAQRTTLISLQQIDRDSAVAQRRLSFGQRIVDVTDGPTQFFQARALSERVSLFGEVNENVGQAISALQNQLTSLSAVRSFINQAIGLLRDAEAAIGNVQRLTALSTVYTSVFTQLAHLADNDAEYGGLNLLNSTSRTLTVNFSDDIASTLTVTGKNLFGTGAVTSAKGNLFSVAYITAAGVLDFDALSNVAIAGFSVLTTANVGDLADTRATLNLALGRLESSESFFGNNIAILQTRLEFGIDYRDNLTIGRDKIVVADVNEEAAILTTLRTRNQIGIGALASNAESEQQLLRLLQ